MQILKIAFLIVSPAQLCNCSGSPTSLHTHQKFGEAKEKQLQQWFYLVSFVLKTVEKYYYQQENKGDTLWLVWMKIVLKVMVCITGKNGVKTYLKNPAETTHKSWSQDQGCRNTGTLRLYSGKQTSFNFALSAEHKSK